MRIANLKKAVWGLMAFASTLVCVMDCYPLIPAVYGVYCLSSGHTIIFYIGLIEWDTLYRYRRYVSISLLLR